MAHIYIPSAAIGESIRTYFLPQIKPFHLHSEELYSVGAWPRASRDLSTQIMIIMCIYENAKRQ